MKKISFYILISLGAITFSSCSKIDNFPEPQETLKGVVTNVTTGKPIQTEAGSSGTRIKLEELSWSDTPTPYYFYSKQDGSFNNTKVFKGRNRITAEGPFVPLVQLDAGGKVTIDKSQTLEIAGVTNLEFRVEPFLNVEWIGEPVYNPADGTITVQASFTRGTTNPAFQQNVTSIDLFINSTDFVGNNNKDDRYSNQVNFNGNEGNLKVGETITIVTKSKLPGSRDYYLRVGARIQYGLNYYNYTSIKKIKLP